MVIYILLFHLFNLVGQLKRLLTGEELNDGVGVEDIPRVNLTQKSSTFFSNGSQTIMEPALKKDTAGKCLKSVTAGYFFIGLLYG